MVRVEKIIHKNEVRIKVELSVANIDHQKIRQVEGRAWSKTLNSWHVPYTRKAYNQLLHLFGDIVYNQSLNVDQKITSNNNVQPTALDLKTKTDTIASTAEAKSTVQPNDVPTNPNNQDVRIDILKSLIWVYLPKNIADIQFLKSIRFNRFKMLNKAWALPNTVENVEKIKKYFGNRIIAINDCRNLTNQNDINSNEWRCKHQRNGRLSVLATYDHVLVDFLKKQAYFSFDPITNTHSIAYKTGVKEQLKVLAIEQQKQITWITEKKTVERQKKPNYAILPNFKPCPIAYIKKLETLNYSENSIRSYVGIFEEFINYYVNVNVEDISPKQVEDFMQYLVTERKFGASSHRNAIAAIRFYYEKMLQQASYKYAFESPRREKRLPEIFSKKEVRRIFALTANTKHQCMLVTAYSCGLRVSELVNLRVSHVDLVRNLLYIKNSKGNKDRYVPIAQKCKEKMLLYMAQYKPKYYFFGSNSVDEPYSARSAQAVFREATLRAGITKEVTFHSLRHSFATHALEGGAHIRLVQDLLGHGSIKTTEMYLHVTNNSMQAFSNPLDSM